MAIEKSSNKKASPKARKTVARPELSTEMSSIFKKPVEAIHVGSNMTYLQRKGFNTLVAVSQMQGDKKFYQISMADYCEATNYTSRNMKHIRDSLDSMLKSQITWSILDVEGQQKWGKTNFLGSVEITGNVIEYEFPEKLKPLLLNPEIYALLDLSINIKYKSYAELALYENTMRFVRIGKTPVFAIRELMLLLGVGENIVDKTEFKYWKRDTLMPTINAVNKVGEINLTPIPVKDGRWVTGMRFTIKLCKAKASLLEDPDTSLPSIMERLAVLQCSENDIKRYIKDYAIDYIDGNLRVVEKRMKSGTVKIASPAAYVAKALADDYRPSISDNDDQQPKLAKGIPEADTVEKQEKLILDKYHDARRSFGEEKLIELKKSQKKFDEMLREFESTCIKGPFTSIYKAQGIESRMIWLSLMDFLVKKYVPEDSPLATIERFKNSQV